MNIEKLIERLRTESLYKDKATLEIMDLCMEAADALSTLQAENEKLWTGLKSNVDLVFRQAKELDITRARGRAGAGEAGEGCGGQ